MPGLFAGKEEAICYPRDSIFICSPPPDSQAASSTHTSVHDDELRCGGGCCCMKISLAIAVAPKKRARTLAGVINVSYTAAHTGMLV